MKVNTKQRYVDFLSHIEFPALIYYYETNRLVGMNQYAVEILGTNVKTIKELTSNKLRPKLPRDLLNNGSKRIRNYTVNTRKGQKILDFEINSYCVDDKHVCIVLFEYSYKNMFHGNQEFMLPRLFWKDKSLYYVGMNESFREDVQLPGTIESIQEKLLKNENLFQTNEMDKEFINDEERMLIKTRQPIFDKVGTLMIGKSQDLFIKYSLIPVFNKNGTAVGILGLYHHIVGKDVKRREIYNAMEHMYISYEKQKSYMMLITEIMRISFLEENSHILLDRIANILENNFNLSSMRIMGCPDNIKIVSQIYQSNKELEGQYKHITRSECKLLYKRAIKLRKYNEKKSMISTDIIFPMNIMGNEAAIIVYEHKDKLYWSEELICRYKDISKIIENIIIKERLYEYYNKEVR